MLLLPTQWWQEDLGMLPILMCKSCGWVKGKQILCGDTPGKGGFSKEGTVQGDQQSIKLNIVRSHKIEWTVYIQQQGLNIKKLCWKKEATKRQYTLHSIYINSRKWKLIYTTKSRSEAACDWHHSTCSSSDLAIWISTWMRFLFMISVGLFIFL